MAGTKRSYVDIKELYYGDVFTTVAVPLTGLTGAEIFAHTWKAVENIHDNTYKYNEEANTVTPRKNQLTGNPYRADIVKGNKSITFTIGEYDYATKAELQGGTAADKQYQAPSVPSIIYKAIKAVTDDGVVIVFPKALISANGANTDGAVGLAVVAQAMDSGVTGLASEIWIDATEVKAAV